VTSKEAARCARCGRIGYNVEGIHEEYWVHFDPVGEPHYFALLPTEKGGGSPAPEEARP
jgi:hypothetical protein